MSAGVSRVLWVEGRGADRLIAVTENGRLMEFLRGGEEDGAAEEIVLGRVVRVMNSMQAAFVDIGQEKNGFLPFNEKDETAPTPRLQCGDRVAVQIKKQAHDAKGAFLSRSVSLCGRLCLYLPQSRKVGVSSRVTAEADRERLKALGRELTGGEGGIVLRAAALTAEPRAVAAELADLRERWQDVARLIPTAHAPSLLYRPRTVLEALLDDYAPRGIDRVVTDDPGLALEGIPTELREPGFMEKEGLLRQRDKALERRVWLESGGELVIDPCEALTVIDVNTAKDLGRRAAEDTFLRADLEAAREAARQIRLRDLSGIIIIDMIDLEDPAHREQVLEALREAFREDRVKTVVVGMTELGLVQLTRKKTRVPLRDEWTEPCPCCGGSGRVKSAHGTKRKDP